MCALQLDLGIPMLWHLVEGNYNTGYPGFRPVVLVLSCKPGLLHWANGYSGDKMRARLFLLALVASFGYSTNTHVPSLFLVSLYLTNFAMRWAVSPGLSFALERKWGSLVRCKPSHFIKTNMMVARMMMVMMMMIMMMVMMMMMMMTIAMTRHSEHTDWWTEHTGKQQHTGHHFLHLQSPLQSFVL